MATVDVRDPFSSCGTSLVTPRGRLLVHHFAPRSSGPACKLPPAVVVHGLGGAAAVLDVIDQLGFGAVHLVGNSMGGAVVTRIAAEHPERVRSLTLIAPALPDLVPRRWPTGLALSLLPGVGPLAARLFGRIPLARRVDTVMRVCLADPRRADRAKRVFRDSRLLQIRGCGHLAQLERTDLVVAAFRQFVTDVERASAMVA